MTREVRALRQCLTLADGGLRRCNDALEVLQPRQPGRITLLETRRKGQGKLLLNDTRWRLVQWRIRRTYSDGSVQWQAKMLPLASAARRTLSRFNFHDTEPEVREVIRKAVALIQWRGRVMVTIRNFVTAAESHSRFGWSRAAANIQAAAEAADRGVRKRARIKAEVVEQLASTNGANTNPPGTA